VSDTCASCAVEHGAQPLVEAVGDVVLALAGSSWRAATPVSSRRLVPRAPTIRGHQ
jgi:hypothetical protein